MVVLTEAMIDAACKAARTAIQNYSQWDSSMIPDDALQSVVTPAIQAVVDILNTPTKGTTK